MILLGLGGNLAGIWGAPDAAIKRAVAELERHGVACLNRSAVLATRPYGVPSQPDFANMVMAVETHLAPRSLLHLCHAVEWAAGRRRGPIWGPRVLDIDILAYHRVIMGHAAGVERKPNAARRPLSLPHPGLAQRAFVLEPLRSIAPLWHHPVSGLSAAEMLMRLGNRRGGQVI